MDSKQLIDQALLLPEEDRTKLIMKLLLSLDTQSDDEIAGEWLVEAQKRARELDAGIVKAIPAEEVRRKAQALLR